MSSLIYTEIQALYQQLLDAWNRRSANGMAELFAEDGEQIGFDGSQFKGKAEIFSHLQPIFADHPTPPYYGKVRDVQSLGEKSAVLRAVAGMVPSGRSDIDPSLNTHHTLIALRQDEVWKILLFQNTPAQFHGRPDLVQELTDELNQLLP